MKMGKVNLHRFDGDGAGAGAAANADAGTSAGDAARQTAENNTTAAVGETGGKPNIPEPDKGKLFTEMVNGEYKEEAQKWFQKAFDKRHKDYKGMQEREQAMQPAMDLIKSIFGWDGNDPQKLVDLLQADNSLWEQKAVENDMTVDQYKNWVKITQENQRMAAALQAKQQQEKAAQTQERFRQQFQEVETRYPGAAKLLKEDFQNETFLRMVDAGVPMMAAFEVVHKDQILAGAMQHAAAQAAGRVADSVAANKRRPTENGAASGQAPGTVKLDVNNMTKEQRRELARRAARGETITL